MNKNPLRVIATCEICLDGGQTRTASVGLDVDYDLTAQEIHEQITDKVYSSLIERDYEVASVVVLNICNLGQVPVPPPPLTKVEIVTPRIPHYTDRYVSPDTCLVCGDPIGHGGLQCPKMAAYS